MNKNNYLLEQTLLEFGPYLYDVGRYLLIEHGEVFISKHAPEKLKEIYNRGKAYFDRMYLRYLYLYNKYRPHAIIPRKDINELIKYCIEQLHAKPIGRIDDPYLLYGHIRNLTSMNPDVHENDLEFIGYRISTNENTLQNEESVSVVVFEVNHDYFGTSDQLLLRELAYQRGIDPEYLDTFNEKAWNYLLDCDFYFNK